MTTTLEQHPERHYAASIAIHDYISTHKSGATALANRIEIASSRSEGHVLDGIERLAETSLAARSVILPTVLDGLKASLLSARPTFDHTSRKLREMARLKGLLLQSPYQPAFATAWPDGPADP